MVEGIDPRIFSAMQTGKPYSTYRKTILGKVYVTVLSPFDNHPEGMILSGDPKTDENASVDIWTEMADVFFKRMNRHHFEKGNLILIKKEEPKEEPKPIEQYSDAELREVLGLRYTAFQKILSEITSMAVLYRLDDLAKEEEKSEKIIGAIRTRLAYLQGESQPNPGS